MELQWQGWQQENAKAELEGNSDCVEIEAVAVAAAECGRRSKGKQAGCMIQNMS